MFIQLDHIKYTNTNGQPDILDIIDKEVPPDYLVENLIIKGKLGTGDIFDILKI